VWLRGWFDFDESREAGSTPDYRYSLANERTFLAWLRTGLALIAGGLGVAQFLAPGWARTSLAVALLILGGAVALRAVDRWARTERAMRLQQSLPPSRFPALLALVIGLGGVVLAVTVTLGAMRS
jgi:putative membrane protein